MPAKNENGKSRKKGQEAVPTTRGRAPIYPVAKWFGYKSFVLRKGKHYTCQTYSMIQKLRKYAGSPEYRLSLQIKVIEDGAAIRVKVRGSLDGRAKATVSK